MTARFDQCDAGEELGVAIEQAVTKGGVIPVRASRGEAWMSAAGDGVVLALDNELRIGKGIVVAGVIDVEMGTDHDVDVIGAQAQRGQMREYVLFVLGSRSAGR